MKVEDVEELRVGELKELLEEYRRLGEFVRGLGAGEGGSGRG